MIGCVDFQSANVNAIAEIQMTFKVLNRRKVIFLTREKEKLDHVRDCLLLMGVLYLRCSACVTKVARSYLYACWLCF